MSGRRNRNGRRGGQQQPVDPSRNQRDDERDTDFWRLQQLERDKAELEAALRYQPRNLEAEAALLGALMIDNRLVETIGSRLKPDHFYEPMHARIYERIVSMVARGRTANPVTIHPYFEGEEILWTSEDGKPDASSYRSYLAQLTGSGAALIGARDFAQQVIDLALLREIVATAKNMAETAANTTDFNLDPREIIQSAETSLSEIAEVTGGEAFAGLPFEAAWDEAFAEIQDAAAGKEPSGIAIDGYDDWNAVVGRMEEGDFILLGARPSMGKTGVACAVALGAAAAGHATEFLSLEMNRRRITRRMIANTIYVQGVTSGYSELGEGRLTQRDRIAIANAREEIAGYPLHISDPDKMAIEELVGFIRRRKRAWIARGRALKLVVIDYLGRFFTTKQFRSETESVSYVSRMLKSAAKETGTALLVLSQLSRDVESRDDKRPRLSDLRQSGSLEQDADTVAFLYRDEYYLRRAEPPQGQEKKWNAWQDDMIATRDRLELYSAKRREGDLLKRTGYFFATHQAVRSSAFYRSDLYSKNQSAFEGV